MHPIRGGGFKRSAAGRCTRSGALHPQRGLPTACRGRSTPATGAKPPTPSLSNTGAIRPPTGSNRQPVPSHAPPGRNSRRRSAPARQPAVAHRPPAPESEHACATDAPRHTCPGVGPQQTRAPVSSRRPRAGRSGSGGPLRVRRALIAAICRSDAVKRSDQTAAEAVCWAPRGHGGRIRRPPHWSRQPTPRSNPKHRFAARFRLWPVCSTLRM